MEINYFAIGKRIKNRRKKLGYTQAKLAELANLSDTNISHIERGTTKLSLPSLIAIANALETTTDFLLMDVVKNSEKEFKKEFSVLLENCTSKEYSLLLNTCKTILETLRD